MQETEQVLRKRIGINNKEHNTSRLRFLESGQSSQLLSCAQLGLLPA